MALIGTWLADSIRRFKAITNPTKYPAQLNFDATVVADPWGDGSGYKQFAMGEFIIHQITMEFDDDMYDQYILFQPAMYEKPGTDPPCLWKIHIPDILDPIWATPPVVLTDINGFITYLGVENSAKNIDLNCTVSMPVRGTTQVIIQFTTVVGMYMFGEANDEMLTVNDWLLKPSRYALSDEPTTNGNEGLPSTFYAVNKWLFGFFIQVLDTDDITIITVNGVNTAYFPDEATPTIGQQILFGKYYNSNNNAIDNPTLINPQFIFERSGVVVDCLHLTIDTKFTFKLDFNGYVPKGAVAYLINTATQDDTSNLLDNYGIQSNGLGYRTVLNTGGTGAIGTNFKAPMAEWTWDSGTIYKLSFHIDSSTLIDTAQNYRMVVIAYSTNNDVFHSYISPQLDVCCDCSVLVYYMLLRHIDCDHATGTVEVAFDTTYNGEVDDELCAKLVAYTFVWSNGVTVYTSTSTPNITGLTAGIWRLSIFGICSEDPLFEYDIEILDLEVVFDVAIIQPCSSGGTGTITATITDFLLPFIVYEIDLEFPDTSHEVMTDGVPYPDLDEGTYIVCVTATASRETIDINPVVTPPEFHTPLADTPGVCTVCDDAIIISSLDINLTVTKGTCDCGAVAVVAPSPAGVYTYLWSTLSTANNVSGLCPGEYWVRVENDLGCIKVEKFTVTANGPAYTIDEITEPAWWPVPCNCSPCKTFVTALERKAYEYLKKVLPHMHAFTDLGYNSDLFGKADCVDVNYNKANDFIYLGIYLMLMEIDKYQYVLNDPDSLQPSNEYLRATWFISCIESYFKCHNINIQELLNVFNAETENTPMDNYIASTKTKRPYPPYIWARSFDNSFDNSFR